jgi:RIO kinase 2
LSSAQIAARAIKDLEPEDWAVLHAIEKSMTGHESVSLKTIENESSLHHDQVEFRLGRLNYSGFVMRTKFGYVLNTAGLDAIALNSLVKRDLISSMGRSIGMGKESDVFEVLNDSGRELVVKFYRIGRVSFRSTRRSRSYVDPENQHQWLAINIGAAQKESVGLKKASDAGIEVPELVARERHAVLMSEIHGTMLYKSTAQEIKKPKELLRKILEDIRKAYAADMINGDISEFNILFDGDKPWIIDWPQFVSVSHSNAPEMLSRDVENAGSFFVRKFGISYKLNDALEYVRGKRKRIAISQI